VKSSYVPVRKLVAEAVRDWLQEVSQNPKASYKAFVRETVIATGCKPSLIKETLSLWDIEIQNDHAVKVK